MSHSPLIYFGKLIRSALVNEVPSPSSNQKIPWAVVRSVIDLSPDGVLVSDLGDKDCGLTYVNRAFERITGYSSSEAIGKNCRYLQGGDRLQPEIRDIRRAIERRRSICVTLRNYHKDGTPFWNELRLEPISAANGQPTHYLGLMRDVTTRKRALDKIERSARFDLLTGSLNRNAYAEEVAGLAATGKGPVLIAKLDVAGFHDINSGYGFDVGDQVLVQIAERIGSAGIGVVGRIDSNEFALVKPLVSSDEGPEIIKRVISALSATFVVSGATITIRFATGFVVAEAGFDTRLVLGRAGAALRRSKSSPSREACEFRAEDEIQSRNRIRLTNEMQKALANDEFGFQYQPKVDLCTGAVVGAEALLRWRHGLFGTQLPGRFINHAEDTGLILEISARGLGDVAALAAQMNERRAEKLHFSVNVSPVEFKLRDMPTFVAEIIAASGIDPSWLTLELTEDQMTENSPAMITVMKRLRELGVGLSIDDFGTGYANLRYLEDFPITELKIDRSFVQGLDQSRSKTIIVEAIVRLSQELGFKIVAEGIETQEERIRLRDMGCELGQGYLFGRPMDSEEFAKIVGSEED
ncbi:putative bifunctional diguanylate cyclase/phosphodiesterase [Bosea sp. 2RAB26]|uniref:putative bifunctional diguanylate cyclase/phosphodiesterase n=1 Tax=Bosea sp. 2RAB26 TaxID=3237476 RepID=UPI003F9224D8